MREIIEETAFRGRKIALFKTDQRADVALNGVELLLASEPNLAVYQLIGPTPLGDLRVIRTEQLPAFRSIVVYFAIDSMDRVHLVDVRWASRVG